MMRITKQMPIENRPQTLGPAISHQMNSSRAPVRLF
jgi:hypothetical protein